jgi:hypothetical protein
MKNLLLMVLMASMMILASSSVQAQSKLTCNVLATELPVLASEWDWRTGDTLWFRVDDGFDADTLGNRDPIWYQYQAETNVLTQLAQSPYTADILTTSVERALPMTDIAYPDFFRKVVATEDG